MIVQTICSHFLYLLNFFTMVKCTFQGCRFVTAYSYPPRPPTCCSDHKQEGMSRYQQPKSSNSATERNMEVATIFCPPSTGPIEHDNCQLDISDVVDLSDSGSYTSNSDTETETDGESQQLVEPPVQNSSHLQSYRGFAMQYPKKSMFYSPSLVLATLSPVLIITDHCYRSMDTSSLLQHTSVT